MSRARSLLDTPLGTNAAQDANDADNDDVLEVTLKGKRYQVRGSKQQVLNLLISTFENAVEKNNELIDANQQLSNQRDKLERQNTTLTRLNEQLEDANGRMERDLQAAARIQHSLLPSGEKNISGHDVAWRYIPCDELAGDFLNFFQLDENHIAIYVVDVSGHGVASSLLSVTVARSLTPQVTTSSILAKPGDSGEVIVTSPAGVAEELNRRFPMEQQGNLYFTMFYGVVDVRSGEVRYVSAGHVPPILLPADGGPAQILPAEGFAVGWMEDIDMDEEFVTIRPGDRLFLFSDGVPEAMDADLEELGDERVLETINETRGKSLDDAVQHIKEVVDQWCRVNGPKDDVSILAIEPIPT